MICMIHALRDGESILFSYAYIYLHCFQLLSREKKWNFFSNNNLNCNLFQSKYYLVYSLCAILVHIQECIPTLLIIWGRIFGKCAVNYVQYQIIWCGNISINYGIFLKYLDLDMFICSFANLLIIKPLFVLSCPSQFIWHILVYWVILLCHFLIMITNDIFT